MNRSMRWALLAVLAALSLFAAACGGDDDNGGGGSQATDTSGSQEGIPQGRRGGDLTFLAAADVDYLDPGQTYYVFGFQVGTATNRTLYAFKPDNSTDADPRPRRRRAADLVGQQDDHRQDPQGREVRPAGRTAR